MATNHLKGEGLSFNELVEISKKIKADKTLSDILQEMKVLQEKFETRLIEIEQPELIMGLAKMI